MKNVIVRVAGVAAIVLVLLGILDMIHVCLDSMDLHLVEGGIQNDGGSSQFWVPWSVILPWVAVIFLVAAIAAFVVDIRFGQGSKKQ